MIQEVTKEYILNLGIQRGFSIAKHNDLPQIGSFPTANIVSISGIEVIDSIEDAESVFLTACSISEENSRDYSPFEYTAAELNRYASFADFEVWETYNNGIHEGFSLYWEELKVIIIKLKEERDGI